MATNGNGNVTTDLRQLTPAERKALTGPPRSNLFTYDDRLYKSFDEFNTVFEYSDLDRAEMRRMLSEDGTPRKLEMVLTLPVRGAPWEIRGSGPAIGLVRDNLSPLIGGLIDQATSAFAYRKAFFETEWQLDGTQVVYRALHMRPSVSCEAAYTEDTGDPDGFRQQLAPTTLFARRQNQGSGWRDGYARVQGNRAFIYTHGTHREPLSGVSDLDVSLWAWRNIKKLQFLWWQYLEGQSLPKLVAWGDGDDEAQRNAEALAKAKASAVVPAARSTRPDARAVDIIESSGKGADQFQEAINYLGSMQTGSVLASFMDLAQHASVGGRGSNALSADQSEFYLGSRESVAGELAQQITEGVIRPLVVNNYGPDVEIPTLHIGPIGNRQTDRALDTLNTLIVAPQVNAPDDFIGFLINHTASSLGLDGDEVAAAVQTWQTDKAAQTQAQMQQPPPPAGGSPPVPPPGQAPAAIQQAARMGQAISLAADLVARARAGEDPAEVLAQMTPPRRPAGSSPGGVAELAADEEPKHTGGMVALVPDAASARALAIEGGEPLEELHLTLCYLGDDVTGWSESQRAQVLERARSVACAPVEARAFAHATFNPDAHADREPCGVYLIGESAVIPEMHDALRSLASALQHPGFVAHVTGGYGKTADDLSYTGPVRFDRLVVALGDQRTEIPLTGADHEGAPARAY